MNDVDNTSGRKWARFTLVATLLVSMIANITHATLAASEITLWLRVPGAAIWPVLSFLAIEIIVRINWRREAAHILARVFVLGPAIPAVIVSYEHQERLLTLMGESVIVARIGPIAIDGLMIGCTLALLFTRERAQIAAAIEEVEEAPTPAIEAEPIAEPEIEPTPKTVRAPRDDSALTRAIEAIQAGGDTKAAATASGLSAPTVRRYASVVRTLKLNPHAAIDARKLSVRPEIVESIRGWARLESVR